MTQFLKAKTKLKKKKRIIQFKVLEKKRTSINDRIQTK